MRASNLSSLLQPSLFRSLVGDASSSDDICRRGAAPAIAWSNQLTAAPARLQAKLSQVKAELKRRMHDRVPEVGKWLRSVVEGTQSQLWSPDELSGAQRVSVPSGPALTSRICRAVAKTAAYSGPDATGY